MSETKDSTDKSLRGGAGSGTRKPLSLARTVESGHVRQNFSHGRSKTVVVETRKSRKLAPGAEPEVAIPAAPAKVEQRPSSAAPASAKVEQRPAQPARTLSAGEMAARNQALAAARIREAEMQKLAELDRVEEARRAAEEAEIQRQQEEEARKNEPEQTSTPEAETTAVAAAPVAPSTSTAPVQDATPATATPTVPATVLVPAPSASPKPAPAAATPARAESPRAATAVPTAAPSVPSRTMTAPAGRPRDAGPRETGRDFSPRDGGRTGMPPRQAGGPSSSPSGARPRDGEGRQSQRPGFLIQGGRPQEISIPSRRPPAVGSGAPAVPVPGEGETPIRPRIARPAAVEVTEDEDTARGVKRGSKVAVKVPKVGEERRERTKLTINNAFDEQQRERSLASLKRKREREKLRAMGIQQTREKIVRDVIIPEVITIQELANRMSERAVDVIKLLMKEGAMHKITDVIDADTAELLVQDFGHNVRRVSEADVEEGFIAAKDIDEKLQPRAPVVTIMGHVDHGKTSLLDAIRQTNVVAGEAGGITQHIGAYQVTTPEGGKITFIDTPGHAAFTAMRARGAKVTDIVILVVAADDGVMPQTIEAINHAKAAGVPIIVAINKIDKPDSDPNRVRTELLQHEIVVESMSGDVLDVPVSATKRTNLDKLLEAIELQAEILQLGANPGRSAEGFVIEAKLERGRGPVGTVLVQRGTLKVGDLVVAGASWGRVRALIDDTGKNTPTAGPSVPVEVLGFDSAPEAGDQFAVVENEARAREITDYRIRKRRETLGSAGTPRTLEQMMQTIKDAAGKKEFNLLIKGDVQGSVEAIVGSLKKIGNDEVEARIVHSGVGGITESDVALAAASKAIVIGFNVRANAQAKQAADNQGIEIRYYSIIYDLVDEVKAAMSGLLAPTRKEVFLGYATIKQVFNISKVGKVAGCQVTEGKVERGAKVRLLRDNTVIHEGTLSILKRFKDEVKEVPAGQECGMAFANYQDIRENDQIECFQVETIARSL
jgi:translation initiation factor IF-2